MPGSTVSVVISDGPFKQGKADSQFQQARYLLDRWTGAQNSSNFATYAECYADSFSGVKRTKDGSATLYDRDMWLNDRKRMFRHSQSVKIKNLRVCERKSGDRSLRPVLLRRQLLGLGRRR